MGRALAWIGWLAFAALVVLGGRLMLDACEVRPWPVFGNAYCPRPPPRDSAALDAERDREQVLRSRLRRAEFQLAALPSCQPPAPEPPPPMAPEPPPVEKIADLPPPPPEPPKSEDLKIPDRVEDLQGCWQSDRGDISIVTDSFRPRPIGVVRVCYCFDDRGRGTIKQDFKDGDHCSGRLTVKLAPNDLKVHHGVIPCSGNKRPHIGETITCKGTTGQTATCNASQHGRVLRGPTTDERFHRVPEEACKWHNGR